MHERITLSLPDADFEGPLLAALIRAKAQTFYRRCSECPESTGDWNAMVLRLGEHLVPKCA